MRLEILARARAFVVSGCVGLELCLFAAPFLRFASSFFWGRDDNNDGEYGLGCHERVSIKERRVRVRRHGWWVGGWMEFGLRTVWRWGTRKVLRCDATGDAGVVGVVGLFVARRQRGPGR
jgi:hypothetical protein